MEEKRLGDVAVTEGWAMLLQYLTDEPAWLSRKLDFPRPDEYAAEGMLWLLFFVRRYSAKLLYELEFLRRRRRHRACPSGTSSSSATRRKIELSPANYLADIDSGFYVYSYLRSWALETQLRDNFRERFGTEWFASREARLAPARAVGRGPEADR